MTVNPVLTVFKCLNLVTLAVCPFVVNTTHLLPWTNACLFPVQRAASGWTRRCRRRPPAQDVWWSCWGRPHKLKVQGSRWPHVGQRGRCFSTPGWESAPKRPSVKCWPATWRITSSEVLKSANIHTVIETSMAVKCSVFFHSHWAPNSGLASGHISIHIADSDSFFDISCKNLL